jgi:hypothetical protein
VKKNKDVIAVKNSNFFILQNFYLRIILLQTLDQESIQKESRIQLNSQDKKKYQMQHQFFKLKKHLTSPS